MAGPSRRLALLLEYDGADYAGSQLQANGPSIQAEVERAIQQMTGSFSRVAFAGRTDAGVHASGQVGTFDTDAPYGGEAFVGGLNVRLPEAIAIRAVREVPAQFDARRQALARRYRYTIVSSTARAPLLRRQAWHVKGKLNETLMRDGATLLLGGHDFAAFAPSEASASSTHRTVRAVEVRRDGRIVAIEIEANAFLMHQVRRTAGALVQLGAGTMSMDEFARRLQEAKPGAFALAAPPHGLCLKRVLYSPPIFDQERE